ncbi:LOW QUALITY PROTEIN: hypothetical protein Fmac_020921 [Flemingia macrophylla]|uniref:Glycosyltransferase n=1 Tax=Flemingia macrophylla TaxID=520843 RepID=A0ABD1LVF2_9FABA
MVEFAALLTKHDLRFFAAVLTISMPQRPLVNTYVQSRASSATNLRLLHLPPVDPPAPKHYHSSVAFLSLHIHNHRRHIRNALLSLLPAAVFVDMFCTSAADVAAELSLPCYLFFTSPASFLSFTLHLPQRVDSESSEFEFRKPLAPNRFAQPRVGSQRRAFVAVTPCGKVQETKGIVVNTLHELEPHALQSLYNDSRLPLVYPIGPVVDLVGSAQWDPNPIQYNRIIEWLDRQPVSSVVFLCFGSMGSLKAKQVEQIAIGLERAGVRFLWALREPPKAQLEDPKDYANEGDALPLPDGFLERTRGMGLVCGWVPQAKVLAHGSIGGFVSHCGWNSILESLWHGVVIATWPMYAEQKMNAFEMVRELGLAVEIGGVGGDLVRAETVESGVRTLMEGADEIRRKVKEMREKCREAWMQNGSSYNNLVTLIQELTT